MNLRRRIALLIVAVVATSVVATAPAPATTSGLVGGYQVGSTTECVERGGVLRSVMTPSNIGIRMRSAWAHSYTSQFIKVSSRLQGRTSGAWSNLKGVGTHRSRTVQVPRSYVQRFFRLTLGALQVGTTGKDRYRATIRIDWYSPKTGRIEGTVKKTYSTVCAAADTPPGIQGLSVVATGTSRQVRATYNVLGAVQAQNVRCSPACSSSLAVPAGGAAAASSLATSSYYADGQPAILSLRTCLTQHPTICSPWSADGTTTFGPIATPTISASPNGSCFTWHLHGDAGGKRATVVVAASGTTLWSYSGTNSYDEVNSSYCPGYSTARTFTVTVTDTPATTEQNLVRATRSATASATTGAPPPTVTVSKGAACGGGGGAACAGGTCPSSSCAYVHVAVANLGGSQTCRAYSDSPDGNWTLSITMTDNSSRDAPWWYGWPNTHVWVTCGSTTSPKFTWY